MHENSITDIFSNACTEFENAQKKFLNDPTSIADFNIHLRNTAMNLCTEYIRITLEMCDEMLRNSPVRKTKGWQIVRRDRKTLISSLGEVQFHKTLFRNTETKQYCYLLDQMTGIRPNERLTDDAVARMLEEAVESSYRRGGEKASEQCSISKETVKDRIHALQFESESQKKPLQKKKAVDYLFIDADEDHVSLQFNKEKGDLVTGANGYKINTETAKLAYVYEGIGKDKGHRRRLIHPHYFSGTYKGEKNEEFWQEVYSCIDHTYDLDKVKAVYLGADGGAWIRGCMNKITAVYALDEFHLRKYLNKMTSHMLDDADGARHQLMDLISDGKKTEFRRKAEELAGYAATEAQKNRIEEGMNYILSNWMPARVRLTQRDRVHGCSAEGHVSHVLSSRMSSRPMGWSSTGVDKMAHLRAYYYNHGDMLELVRNQPESQEELPMVAGAEEVVMSASEILQNEHQMYQLNGKYIDSLRASINTEASKLAWFNGNIWGL